MNFLDSNRRNLEWNRAAQHLKWRHAGDGIIPMASGEHDFQPPRDLFRRTVEGFHEVSSAYGPLAGLPEVRQEIAKNKSTRNDHHVPSEFVHLVPTVSIGLALVANAIITGQAHIVLLGDPTYYAISAPMISRGASCTIIDISSPDWKAELQLRLNDATIALCMSNPHSPTGHSYTVDDLRFVSNLCEYHDVTIISDDVYECMPLRSKYTPIYSISDFCRTRSVVFSSYAKCYNVCGVSASFCICSPELFSEICSFYGGPVFMCNLSSQLVILDCLRYESWIDELNTRLIAASDYIFEQLDGIRGIEASKPNSGMFLWCKVVGHPELSAVDAFRSVGIEVMCGSQFYNSSPKYCRLNFGTYPEVLADVIERIRRI